MEGGEGGRSAWNRGKVAKTGAATTFLDLHGVEGGIVPLEQLPLPSMPVHAQKNARDAAAESQEEQGRANKHPMEDSWAEENRYTTLLLDCLHTLLPASPFLWLVSMLLSVPQHPPDAFWAFYPEPCNAAPTYLLPFAPSGYSTAFGHLNCLKYPYETRASATARASILMLLPRHGW